jgi:chromosome segregation ATPase
MINESTIRARRLIARKLAHGYTLIDRRCPDPLCDLPLIRKKSADGAGPLECVAVALGWHGAVRFAPEQEGTRSDSALARPRARAALLSARAPVPSPTRSAQRRAPLSTPTREWSVTEADVGEHTGRRAEAASRVRALQSATAALQTTLSPDGRSTSSAHMVAEGLRRERDELRDVLAQAHSDLATHAADSQRTAISLESEVRRLKLQLGHAGERGDAVHSRAQSELQQASAQIDRLQREVGALHADASEADRIIEELHARSAVGEEHARLAAALQSESASLEARIARAADHLAAARAESTRHRDAHGDVSAQLERAVSATTKLRSELAHRESTAEVLARQHAAERAAMASTHVELEAAARAANVRAHSAIGTASDHFSATDAKLASISLEHRTLRERHAGVLAAARAQHDDVASELAAARRALAERDAEREASVDAAHAAAAQRCSRLEARLRAAEAESAERAEQIAAGQYADASWQAQVEALRSELRARVSECESLRVELATSRAALVQAGRTAEEANRIAEVSVLFMYRYILRESCSQFDSLPLTSLTSWRRIASR